MPFCATAQKLISSLTNASARSAKACTVKTPSTAGTLLFLAITK